MMVKCKRCKGSGIMDETFKIGEDIYGDGAQECPDCNGDGIE